MPRTILRVWAWEITLGTRPRLREGRRSDEAVPQAFESFPDMLAPEASGTSTVLVGTLSSACWDSRGW